MKSIDESYSTFGKEIVDKLLYIDCTSDKRYIYWICELYKNEEADENQLYNVFNERYAIVDYLSEDNVNGKDIFELANENAKGAFRKRWYSTPQQFDDFKKTIIYEDETTTINKPTSFTESQNVGNPIWCFCYKQDKWDQHNQIDNETIYFVHSAIVSDDWQYNAVCVRTNGDRLILDGQHNYLSRRNGEVDLYLSQIGGVDVLITDKITNESKATKYMEQNKKTINEAQLRAIVKEAVKSILKESTMDLSSEFKTVETYVEKARYALGGITFKYLRARNVQGQELLSLIEKIQQHLTAVNRLMTKCNFAVEVSNPNDELEPEDWYERNEHGDFDSI